MTDPTADPVLARRERIRHWCALGQRVGYTLLLVFTVAAFAGLVTGFPSWLTTIAWVSVGLATVILAPAIVFAYAVKAADRADREDDW